MIERTRNMFLNGKTKPLEWRIKQLKQAQLMIKECKHEILSALASDLHKVCTKPNFQTIYYLSYICKYVMYSSF